MLRSPIEYFLLHPFQSATFEISLILLFVLRGVVSFYTKEVDTNKSSSI